MRYLKRLLELDYRQMWEKIKRIKKRSGRSYFFIIYDIIRCSRKFGSGYIDYCNFHFEELSDELKARMKDTINSQKKIFNISRAPANGTIDYQEEKAKHFARGLNGYKLFLILFVGSFAGVVIELLWCFLRHGYFESRSGLVYGPSFSFAPDCAGVCFDR